jgi:hypothetical protein
MKIFYLSLICLFSCTLPSAAQHSAAALLKSHLGRATPDGIFDTLRDQLGNKYTLSQIAINPRIRQIAGGNLEDSAIMAASITPSSCNSGYFQLWIDDNSGLDGNSAAATARKNVFCQVMNDLSNMIHSPLNNNGGKVNIWVRDYTTIPGIPVNAIGLANSFYQLPYAPAFGGIADNTVWKTILTGKDAYTNVVLPLQSTGDYAINTSGYFHGFIAFNFNTINWHTDMSTPLASGEYDLYTVVLHEMLHALGFYSLIDSSGHSKFGTSASYYSRYDKFLKTQSGANLITDTGSCGMYGYHFNTTLTPSAVLTPNTANCITNSTTASTAIKFNDGTINQDVYTSNCWEPSSSLAHFEDQWQVPATFISSSSLNPPLTNDQYFVMSNATLSGPVSTNPGAVKRYPRPEERQVLCSLGYNVDNTYGSAAANNVYNYTGSACPGVQVAGVNDGIQSGSYTYVSNNGSWVWVHDILNNDANANKFECLQLVSGSGNISSITDTSFYFAPTALGIHLLRYVPVNTVTGKRGNITYIFILNKLYSCPVFSPCTMVPNGDFEASVDCGDLSHQNTTLPNFPTMSCWDVAVCTPDLYTRNCALAINQGAGDCNIPTFGTTPPTDSHVGSNGANDHFIGLFSSLELGYYLDEAMQTRMATSLQPGAKYKISCWAKINNGLGYANSDNALAFCVSANPMAQVFNTFSAPGTLIDTFNIRMGAVNDWRYYSKTITYNGPAGLNNFIVGGAPYLYNGGQAPHAGYIFVDDVSIEQVDYADSLALPLELTTCQTIPDLSIYVYPSFVGNGYFSGPGVSMVAGHYSFNALTAATYNGGPGWITISYSHPDAAGCIHTTYGQIHVKNLDAAFTASASPDTVCTSNPVLVQLSASGAPNYSWSPTTGLSCTTCPNPTVTSSVTTSYVVTSNDTGGCHSVAGITVYSFLDTPSITINATMTTVAVGSGAGCNAVVTGMHSAYTVTWYVNGVQMLVTNSPYTMYTYLKTAGIDTITAIVHSLACLNNDTSNVVYIHSPGTTNSISYTSQQNPIRVYPNPAHYNVHIDNVVKTTTTEKVSYSITNMLGAVVKAGDLQEGDNTASIEDLPNGIYILQVLQIGAQNTYKDRTVVRIIKD